ncbi:MAG: hypothetical protein PHY47_01020 [Lachnospiraceae bacterium]|nr:hypothetical protein [Lachnospiraceae bacterium]
MHNFKIILGDPTWDGHGRHEEYIFLSSAPLKEVEKAYKKGVAFIGLDVTHFCQEHEESSISMDTYNILKDAGVDVSKIDSWDEDWMIYPETLLHLILETIRLSGEEIEISEIPSSAIPTFSNPEGAESFGYGLFAS